MNVESQRLCFSTDRFHIIRAASGSIAWLDPEKFCGSWVCGSSTTVGNYLGSLLCVCGSSYCTSHKCDLEAGTSPRGAIGGQCPPWKKSSPQGNAPPGRNPCPRAMQYNRIPANLSKSYSCTGLQFSPVHWPKSLETPKIFIARYARMSRKTLYPCTKRN